MTNQLTLTRFYVNFYATHFNSFYTDSNILYTKEFTNLNNTTYFVETTKHKVIKISKIITKNIFSDRYYRELLNSEVISEEDLTEKILSNFIFK